MTAPGNTALGTPVPNAPRRSSSRRSAVLLVLASIVAGVAGATVAWAYWGAVAAAGGHGVATAASVNQAAVPSAAVGAAQAVTVSWTAATHDDTQPVSGYSVKRYDAVSNVVQTTGAGCSGIVTALTCTEAAVPMGQWKYTVTPLSGTNWQGAESVKSSQVTVGASVLTLAKTVFGAPLPSTTTGTLAGFGTNEGLTYRLDAGTALTGSPAATDASGAATITALTIPGGTSEGAHTVYAVGAGGSLASFNIVVDTTTPTVAAQLSPAANGGGWHKTSPVTVTLTGDGTGSGITQIRYTLDGTDPTVSGTATAYSTPLSVPATTTVRYYATDAGGNSSAVQTTQVKIDLTAPVNALALSGVTGTAVKTGNTIYYRGTTAGSFTLTNTLTDSGGSGAASSGTAALAGTATGWTHTSSTVSTPAGGPYVSGTFSWTAGATTSPTESVTGTDVAGNTVTTQLTFVDDSAGPTGGSVDATGLVGTSSRYSTSTTLSIAFSKGTDTTAIPATGAQLLRASATLASTGTPDGSCGTYTDYALVTGGADPVSPKSDTVTDQTCYRYRYVVPDTLGNTTTYTSGDIKVDTTAPSAPTLAFSALSNVHPVGMTVYYRPGAATGSFTTTAAASDLASGIASYAFPTLGTNWTSTPGTTGINTYSWNGAPAAPGAKTITATNNATTASAATTFTPTADGSAPTGGSASHVNGYTTGLAVTVTFTGATGDVGSGIDPTSGRLKRTSTPLVNGVCGGATSTVNFVNPTSPYTDTTVTGGNCYDYQYIMADNVGNTAFWQSGSIAKVDYAGAVNADAGLLSHWRLGESSGTTMADSKGSNTGSYANGPTLGTAGAISGDANTAATYNGTTQYSQALATTGVPVGAASRSVEMWFKTTNTTARQTLFEYGSFGTGQEFGLYLRANYNDIVAWGFGGAGYDYTYTVPFPIKDGNWHQVVNTYDGTTLAIYVDGKLLASQATPRNTVMDGDGSFGIGAALPLTGNGNSGGYFNGSLDEVSLYTNAMSAATVADHYNLAKSTDTIGPVGGGVDAIGLTGTGSRYSTSTNLSIGFTKGTDSAGVTATGAQLTRASGTLSSGGTADATCTAWTGYTLVSGGTDPASPKADTVSAQACYRYQYAVTDSLGNTTTYTSGDIKVDTSASSTPTLAFSGFSNTYWAGSGSTVYYRSGASTGAFTATATSADANSGIAGYAFPALGTNWTSTPGATGVHTYSWNGAPAVPGAKTVTATNNAGLVSATAAFTPTADGTAPAGGSVSYLNGSATAASISVSFTPGTDGGSGLNPTSGVLQRARALLTNGTCGSYATFTTISLNPTSIYTDSSATNGCYKYQYLFSDNVGNTATYTSASVAKLDYAAVVNTTAGAISQWRLGEASTVSDTFTDTTGTVISSHTGEIGASWTRWGAGSSPTGLITASGTLRKSNATGGVTYYASATPPSANYQVEADVVVKSLPGTATDIGVIGRLDTAATGDGTFYLARYNRTAAAWQLIESVNGTAAVLGTYAQALSTGVTYHLGLDMSGSTISVLVDGVSRISVADSTITAAGRAGVRLGAGTETTTQSDTVAYHLDNVQVSPAMADSKGTNHGDYAVSPTLGVAGVLSGDTNTAATFNGTNQYATAARQISDDFSIELWFKSTQGIGTGAQWWEGAGLVDTEKTALWYDFGVSLRADGKVVAGTGGDGGDVSIVSSTGGYNDDAWHHVVFTRTRTSGALRLYVDGASAATGTGSTSSLTTTPLLNVGRLASGSNYFAGSLDEIAVYNTAISAGSVLNHYNLGASDSTGPTGGSVDATGLTGTGGRYATTTAVNLAFTPGTDAGSGLAYSGAQLRRSTATLTSAGTANGTCGTYNTSVQVGADDPASPYADTVPAGQACYRYEYVVSDSAGNTTTYLSGDIKVDTTAPAAPTFGFSAMTNAYASGSTVYYRPAATSGGFTVAAAATDTNSGIASYTMPTLGTGWSVPSGTTGVQAYSWSSANPTSPVGAQNVTATNNASLTSTAGFTVTADSTAPATGTINYTDGYYASASVTVTFTAGASDTGSGVNAAGGLLQRRSATLSNGTCGTFGAFATITGGTNPISPFADTTVVAGNCYQYQYVTTDNVGNQDLSTVGANTVKFTSYTTAVSSSTGLVSQWRLGDTTTGTATDTFAGTTGGTVSSRTGENGVSWTAYPATNSSGTITATNRVRPTVTTNDVTYYASTAPSTANYRVEADIMVTGTADDSTAGVVGRLDTTVTTNKGKFYTARYNRVSGAFQLRKSLGADATTPVLDSNPADAAWVLNANVPTRIGLEMNGTTIRLLVNGTVMITGTDDDIAGAGRAGIRLKATGAPTDTQGTQLDNFSTTATLDSKSTNNGTYVGGVTLGVAGAITGDANTAVTFNGTSGYATVARQVQDDYSVEFWFKSTQGIGTGPNWHDGAGLVDADTAGSWDDFGVSLRSDGRIMAGNARYANAHYTITSAAGGYNDGGWHHVVFTRNRTTTAMVLYADGVAVASGNGAVTGSTTTQVINFGRLASGNNYYAGSLDEIAVYNTAVSAATVTDHYNLGAPDTAGPTGGSVDATGLTGAGSRYSTTTNLSISFTKGTDARSGLAPTGAQLRRSTATLTSAGSANGTCGSYNTSVQVGADDPASPAADTVPAGQACYRYEYVVPDTLGNTTTYLSGDIKVDTTAPAAPTFVFSALTNAYWSGSGSNVYYRRGASSGSFTATATTIDTQSGIAGYTMPPLGTGWTAPAGTNGVQAYAWSSANPAAPAGAQNATATNNATLTSAAGGFTMTADDTAPTAGSITYTDGAYTTASVSIAFTSGTDAGAGLDTAGRLLQRASAPMSDSTCGSYGAFATVTGGTNPTSPFTDTTIIRDNCYQYRYVTADYVGNEFANTSASTVRYGSTYATTVLATGGLTGYYRLDEASGTTMTDLAPSPNNGTYNAAGVTLGAPGGLFNDANTAATFNGSTGYAAMSRQISDNFSIEFRFKSTQNPPTAGGLQWWHGNGLVDADVTGTTNDFGVALHEGGAIAAGTGTLGGSDATIITSTSGYNDGQWHHVVFTRVRSGGAMKIYVDGVLRASGTGGTNSLTASANLNIGRQASGGKFAAGTIDEVSLYTAALSADTVLDHYNQS